MNEQTDALTPRLMFEPPLQGFDSMRRELGLQRFVFAGHRYRPAACMWRVTDAAAAWAATSLPCTRCSTRSMCSS
jgi:hypothetical protein